MDRSAVGFIVTGLLVLLLDPGFFSFSLLDAESDAAGGRSVGILGSTRKFDRLGCPRRRDLKPTLFSVPLKLSALRIVAFMSMPKPLSPRTRRQRCHSKSRPVFDSRATDAAGGDFKTQRFE